MHGVGYLVDLGEEFINVLIYFVPVLRDTAVPHLGQLTLEILKVLLKPLHQVYDYRPQV